MTVASPTKGGRADAPERVRFADMAFVAGGTFRMGSDQHYPEERPVHRVSVSGF